MRIPRFVLIPSLCLLLAGLAAALFIKWRGFRASTPPTALESTLATTVRDFAIPHAEHTKTDPVANDPVALQQGREDFLTRCASCHGVDATDELRSERMFILGFPTCTRRHDPEPDRWRDPLHYRKWDSTHRYACNGEFQRRLCCGELETCLVHSQLATSHFLEKGQQRRVRPAFSALCWLRGLSEMPPGHL